MSAELAEGGESDTVQLCRGMSPSLGELRQQERGRPAQRSGTWQHWPFTYMFVEYVEPSPTGATYQLSRLSAQRIDTGLHDFKGFFLDDGGALLHVVELHVDTELIANGSEAIADSVAFELEHGFTVPSPEDFIEVEVELRRGFMDGVTPL